MQAYKGKGQEYRLFWPSRPEFVRMAARYGATIVPFAGVGAEEGFNMLLDSQEIRNLPVVGRMIEERSRRDVPRARRWAFARRTLHKPRWYFVQPGAASVEHVTRTSQLVHALLQQQWQQHKPYKLNDDVNPATAMYAPLLWRPLQRDPCIAAFAGAQWEDCAAFSAPGSMHSIDNLSGHAGA